MKRRQIILFMFLTLAVLICGLSFIKPAPMRILISPEDIGNVAMPRSAAFLPYETYFVRVNNFKIKITGAESPPK